MKFFYSFLFIAAFVSTSMAQLGFDIAAKGQVNSTWLFNQNISDQGKEQDYAPSWGSNYGLGFGLRMGFFSVGLETNFGAHNAEYAGEILSQSLYLHGKFKNVSNAYLPAFPKQRRGLC